MSNCVDLQNKYDSLVSQQELMQRQMNLSDLINGLLSKNAEALTCGPECQRQKMIGELQQKYLDAQTNLQTAPINLEDSRKNYYVYKEGQPYYDHMLEEELKQKAEHIARLLTESFNEEVANTKTMNQYYNTDIINSRYTKELLANIRKKNLLLKAELRKKQTDILTNDRKTYYENTAYDNLSTWYRFWWYFYYILVFVFVIAIFVSPNSLSMIKKILLLVLLLFYPYYIDYVRNWMYTFYMNIYNSLPKSVYNNL